MLPKTHFITTLIGLVFLSIPLANCDSGPSALSPNAPSLHFSFDDCVSFIGQSSLDYSEFTAVQTTYPECSSLEMASPDHVFRGDNYGHSCTPGIGNTNGMCFEGFTSCFYDPGNSNSLKFNVNVIPGPEGFGSIEKLSFYEQAPEQFTITNGATGPNDYPTKLALRVLVEGVEVFRNIDYNTSRTWALKEIDFGSIAAFTVTEVTEFRFEFLPYCPVGNGAGKYVWDIDEMTVLGGCNNINGGMISTNDNTSICISNNDPTVLSFQVSDVLGSNASWLAVDENNTIITVRPDNQFDFANQSNGNYTVYHLAYEGTLTGLSNGLNLSDLSGCYDLSNGIVINIDAFLGGRLLSDLGFIDAFICDSISENNIITTTLTGAVGQFSNLLLVDDSNIIIESFQGPSFDFSDLPDGSYSIVAASHNGSFFNSIPGTNLSDLSGCYALSTSLRIEKDVIEIGTISFNGSTMIDLCGAEGMVLSPDITGPQATNPQWIVTNASGRILNIFNSLPIDITNLNSPQIEVRLMSFLGRLSNFTVDSNISEIEGCFLLSNPIMISNESINGGTIDIGGQTEINVCYNDASSVMATASLSGNEGGVFNWIVSNATGEILEITDTPNFNFTSAGVGTCLIRHLSYFDDLTGLAVGNTANDLVGCYAFSNSITVNRFSVDAGAIAINNQTEIVICSGDGFEDNVTIDISGNDAPTNRLVITESDGTVISFLDGNTTNFEGVPSGTCFIYNVAADSSGVVDFNFENISEVTGCMDVSNSITVIRNEVKGGSLTASDMSTCISIITGDSVEDSVQVILNDNIGDNFAWLLTDGTGTIIDLPSSSPFGLDNMSADTAFIWNISYSGMISGLDVNQNVSGISGCFSISNSLKVYKENLASGSIATSDGMDAVSICLGGGEIDSIDVVLTGSEGPNLSWIITDDQGKILELPMAPPFDFSSAGSGVCRIYHIAYMSGLQGLDVDANVSSLAGAFDLSDPIVVTRSFVDGGSIQAMVNGESGTEFSICSGDGIMDLLNITIEDAVGTNSQWVITDTLNNILEINDDAPIDFEGVVDGVCWIYHLSSLPGLTGLEMSSNLSGLMGCFDLSNAISIERNEVNGGVLSTALNQDTISIIVGDLVSDSIEFNIAGVIGDTSILIITDALGNIVAIPDSNTYDFNSSDAGTCVVWNLSAVDALTNVAVGTNVTALAGCLDFSNPITIEKGQIMGGSISTLQATELCLSDLMSDTIDVTLMGNNGTNSAWVITDTTGVILDLPMSPPFDFRNTGGGVCVIWHLAYENNLTGLDVDSNVSGLTGTFNFSNAIEVTRNEVIGGTLLTTDNQNMVSIMVDDGTPDSIDFIIPTVMGADTSIWIVTDTLGNIISLPDMIPLDFENAGNGVCRVWYLSYIDQITGVAVDNNLTDIGGCFALSSPVTIERQGITGGNLMTSDNLTQLSICVGDGVADPINVILTDTLAPMHTWVITDTLGEILDLPMGPPFDFETAGTGACQIWNLAHNTNLMGLTVGQNVSGLTGNFNFSNPITVFRGQSVGGNLTTSSGDTEVTITLNDNIPELIGVSIMGSMGDNTAWVITDTLGNIIDLPTGPPFNFENAPEGVCQIWNLSYGDGLVGLEIDSNVSGLTGCFEFSNAITVTREELVILGGSIIFSDNTTTKEICAGDGVDDPLDILLTGQSGPNFQYVITDTFGVILGLPPGGGMDTTINLENAGGGIANIWHISYASGIGGLSVGLNIDNLTGIYDISDSLIVDRTAVDGGTIALTNGALDTIIMINDSFVDSLDVNLSGAQGDTMMWIITDGMGEILMLPDSPPFEFENAGVGNCFIWNLSTSDNVTGVTIGQNVSGIMGCFDLSNSISVVRIGLNGGNIATPEGATEVDVCYNGNTVPPINVNIDGNGGANQQWVITSDLDTILGLPMAPPFDLTNAGVGVCKIYNLSYETGLTGLEVGNSLNQLIGNRSFSNAITVTRNESDAGTIQITDGTVLDSIMINDMMPDTINLMSMGTVVGDSTNWIATDASGTIVAVQDTSQFIFESQGGGTCQLWNIAYDDALTGLVVNNNVSDLLGCFDLSNPVTIVRLGINGGLLTSTAGETNVSVCSGGGSPVNLDVMVTDTSGTNHQYILVDNGLILSPQVFPPIDFTTFAGSSRELQLYNIAYEDGLSGLTFNQPLSGLTGVFDLSNPLNIDVNINSVGLLLGNSTIAIDVIVGEGINDTIFMNTPTVNADTTTWLILNEAGEILEIPTTPPFLFEDSNLDSCFIHLVAHSYDATGLVVGQNVSNLGGCFQLSNEVAIAKHQLNAGTLSATGDLAAYSYCVGDGVMDTLSVSIADNIGDNQRFILVDSSDTILLVTTNAIFDFEGLGGGECKLYSISYTDGLQNLEAGQKLSDLGDFYLLSNLITIQRNQVLGGMISIVGAAQDSTICINDAISDVISFETNSNSLDYAYVITGSNNVIDTIVGSNMFDFQNANLDTNYVWGISFTGNFTAMKGDSLFVDDLSSQCYDVSGNALEIIVETCPGIPVLNELTGANMVEIKNVGFDTINITGYQLCNNGVYEEITAAMVNCGDLNIPPGELVSLNLSGGTGITIDPTDGEMALYIDDNFISNQSIIDYVQWGDTMHLRTNIAIGAGIWSSGDAVDPFMANNSLRYDGFGDSSSDWVQGATGLCIQNIKEDEEDESLYKMYPIPTSGMLNIELLKEIQEPVTIEIYDSNGRIVHTSTYNEEKNIRIDLEGYAEGMYYSRLKIGRKTNINRLLILK